MWRAMFLAIGASALVIGLECLAVDKVVLSKQETVVPADGIFAIAAPATARNKEIVPPDWAAWSLLSGGALTILYSYTLPRLARE